MTSIPPPHTRKRAVLARAVLFLIIGMVAVLGLNLLAIQIRSDCGLPALLGMDACSDDIVRVGWPLSFYEHGGVASHDLFSTSALETDVLVGIAGTLLIAMLLMRFKRSG